MEIVTAEAFREALEVLGWTHAEAAEALGVASRPRVTEWANGTRPVPDYIAAHVRTLLACRGTE